MSAVKTINYITTHRVRCSGLWREHFAFALLETWGLRHESVTLLPRDQRMTLFLAVLSCFALAGLSSFSFVSSVTLRSQQCLVPTNSTELLLVQEKYKLLCGALLLTSLCPLSYKDKVWIRVFTLKQLTDALSSTDAASAGWGLQLACTLASLSGTAVRSRGAPWITNPCLICKLSGHWFTRVIRGKKSSGS